jgi:hypothetical protein
MSNALRDESIANLTLSAGSQRRADQISEVTRSIKHHKLRGSVAEKLRTPFVRRIHSSLWPDRTEQLNSYYTRPGREKAAAVAKSSPGTVSPDLTAKEVLVRRAFNAYPRRFEFLGRS